MPRPKTFTTMRKFLFIAAIALLAQTSFAQTSFNKAKMDSLMDALAVNNKAMVSIAIRQNGNLLYTRAIGYSVINASQKIPATPQTHYRIGSVSKVFTSVIIFQLIEEGKLTLATPLAKFFPELPNAAKITIAHMLNHNSGLHNFTSDSSYLAMMTKKITHVEMLVRLRSQKSDFEPGSKNEYSNTNFLLLGYIAEKLDKKPYAEILKTRITNKIGLRDTYYGGKINPDKQEAQSYTWKGNSWQPATETDMSVPGGAGALVSTPTDLTKFMDALFTGKLVSDSSLTHMKTIKGGFGMDLMQYPFYSNTGFGHNGGIDGFLSQVIYFPDGNVASSYTTNGSNTNLNDLAIGMLSTAFNKTYAIPSFKTITLKTEDLDQYLGTYSSQTLPLKVTFTKAGAQLMAQATGQGALPLDATGPNEFKYDAAGAVFIFDPANNHITLRQNGKSYLFTKEK
jgi:D-alanyl-D-alanine carboxypeptidase